MIAGAAAARPHTRATLAAQFRAVGVRPGGTVLVHVSLRPVGFLCGGPEAVALALRDVLGAAVLTGDGGRAWVWWDDIRLDDDRFARLGTALEATGAVRLGPVGDGTGRLMRQRVAVDFAVDWLARNRGTEES
ncbi:AAC(3) family N-acetyltransferase [Micromonospora sp. CB01531]|uniref:AAC(3) family N-acetyltransferase n=1 Tax=Micromonospora sp. CB01531 TaxID=1718947 RepID=UPI00093DE505|nr:AAC(3) family N-acetyltransferase [Micromonospora sp. CB01531]OKI45772.1 hypothetical protein A6A27_37740 [Micromonospora sp. CB01531]